MPPIFSPYGTDAISVGIPYWLDLLTVIIGAISGILVARDRHLDLVGFVGLGLLGCRNGVGRVEHVDAAFLHHDVPDKPSTQAA